MNSDTEIFILRLCGLIWEATYKIGLGDEGLFRHIESLKASVLSSGEGPVKNWESQRMACTTKWIDCGAPRLVTDEKYAAALMCTRVTENLVDDIIFPWKAFRIDLPYGLLRDGEARYDCILVCYFEERGAFLLLEGSRPLSVDNRSQKDEIYTIQTVSAPNMAALLLDRERSDSVSTESAYPISEEDIDAKERALRLAKRLVVGLLYTMQYTNHFKPAPASLNDVRRTLRTGPPRHRTIFVGKPIALDTRPAVREFLGEGKGGAPSVQTLVRGHFKRQVIGVSRGGRKVIWIEPYWRGPEEAPILARPYLVSTTSKAIHQKKEM